MAISEAVWKQSPLKFLLLPYTGIPPCVHEVEHLCVALSDQVQHAGFF